MMSSCQQKPESPVSASIAIEFTSLSVAAFINNTITDPISFEEAINYESPKNKAEIFEKALWKLDASKKEMYENVTYWTIGIPDNSSQNTRKAILQAVENYRVHFAKIPTENLEDYNFTEKLESKPLSTKPPPPPPSIRLINRSTAGAISLLQSMRDEERRRNLSETDVDPYYEEQHFLVFFIDGIYIYGTEFKTLDGVVQHHKTHMFKSTFEASPPLAAPENCDSEEAEEEEVQKEDEEEIELLNIQKLWKKLDITWDIRNPILLTHNSKSFLIDSGVAKKISEEFVTSPPDKFSLFTSINGKSIEWPAPELFILKGVNVKARMLAGDADLIDYDVSGGFVGKASIECEGKFKASLIRDGEKLPIKRTIFKSKKPIPIKILLYTDLKNELTSVSKSLDTYVCEVDENGIFKN